MPIDKQRLIKILMMTQSANDQEALLAIRKANALMAVDGTTWGNIFGRAIGASRPIGSNPNYRSKPSGRGTTTDPRHNPPKPIADPEIPKMIKSLLRDAEGSFYDFIFSLKKQWDHQKYLTERQYGALCEAYEKAQ